MKVFLAGGTGVIGTRALPALVAEGHEVTAIARTPAKAELVRTLGGTPVEADLFDPDSLKGVVTDHDVVINLATSIPPMSKAARTSAWDVNERIRKEGAGHLVDAALTAGASRFVQESIAFPYVDNGSDWIDEDHPMTHVGAFDGSQQAEASALRFVAEGGGVAVVLRFAQFYAPDSTHTIAANKSLRARVNPFLGAPEAYSSWIHAEDAGSAVAAALHAPTGIYNVGDDEPLTREEAGRAAAEALGVKPPKALPALARKASPASAKLLMRSLRVSNARFKAVTGWSPAHRSLRGSWPA